MIPSEGTDAFTRPPHAEWRALSAQVQRDSWRADPHFRRKQLAIGHVTSLLRQWPNDLCAVLVAAVEAATEDGGQ